jgi:Enoyl-CoA hydratase/isomerase
VSAVEVPAATLAEFIQRGDLADVFGPLIITDRATSIDGGSIDVGSQPCVVIGSDVVPRSAADLERIVATVTASPIASISACVLLRSTDRIGNIEDRLAMESATYSTLQSGPEFSRWRASRRIGARHEHPTDPLVVQRVENTLRLTLNRPERSNAMSVALRDALCDALLVAEVDPTIAGIELAANGTNFCTGGDLDEFASFDTPAAAHIVRLQRSPARSFSRGASRLTAYLHGLCLGSGIELAAFARRVVAHPDSSFGLPELSLRCRSDRATTHCAAPTHRGENRRHDGTKLGAHR